MERPWIFLAVLVILSQVAIAQHPTIFSVDRTQAAMQEIVTLHGTDFGTDPSVVKVFFGGISAEISSLSNQLVEVRTPAGATFGPISVTNTVSGKTGYAPTDFLLNYQGQHGISATTFSAQSDFQAQDGLYDLCLCDLDDDGKVDVATASTNSNLIALFRNAGSPGNINLIRQDFLINARTLHVKCGDLNGDGKPDIVLTEGADGDRVFILANSGNFSFSLQAIALTGIKVKQLAIADLDIDGKPDIVVSNTGANTLTILPNVSTVSTVAFGSPLMIAIPEAASTDAIAVSDLNGDSYPEIITSQYQTDNANKLYIAVNNGSFNFSEVTVIAVNKALSSIRVGDLDGDAKPDLAAARLTGGDVTVYLNNSGSDVSFRDPVFFFTETLPVGLDIGDFDGDGKPDLAVGSIAKAVTILNNTTATQGSATFDAAVKVNTTYVNRHLLNADMDGDGKPDLVFTSVDDFTGIPVLASKVSVIRNLACMVPEVSPEGAQEICSGTTLQLIATAGGGTTYEWYRSGTATPVKSGPERWLDVTASGAYSVTALSGSGACSNASATVEVTVSTPTTALTQEISDARSNSPVCTGNTLDLVVNDVGATEYRWRGPNGFFKTVSTPSAGIPDFTMDAAGLYIVEMVTGTCVAKTDSTLVEAVSIPDFSILVGGSATFCDGDTRMLTIVPRISSGFDFQWYEKSSGAVDEATFDNYSAMTTGEYYAVITPGNSGCSERETPSVMLTTLQPPTPGFSAPETACAGEEIALTQQSDGDPNGRLVYQWAFGQGSTSDEVEPVAVYDDPDSYEVTMAVSYDGVAGCEETVSQTIDIVAPALPEIISSATSICEGEEVTLAVGNSFYSVSWNNGETSAETTIYSAGDYSVSTVDANGCAGSDAITISEKPVPTLSVSAEKQTIAAGQSVQLHASGADTYAWSPEETLNDPTIADPVASPLENVTYFVTGSLADGCAATGSVAIQVSGEVVSIVVPVVFSPNGDAVNEMLVIEGIENYPECSLSVFDRRGGRVFASTGYQNNWDGTMKGTPLPEGVYYYVFGCPGRKAVTGTVTVIR